jgi:fermentation-respiration switch protein FrsA (DUF1100 family)
MRSAAADRTVRKKGVMEALLTLAGAAFAIYALAAASLYVMQRRLIYVPDPARHAPAEAGLADVREIQLATPDGERLIAWRAQAAPGQPTLLYFHGNAGNLFGRADRIQRFSQAGLGVFMLSYRGYSGSTGKPSERANVADAVLAYEHLRGEGVAVGDIVAYGESLGSGVAVQLAASRPVGALILDAPYTSLVDIGKSLYPSMPVDLFIADRYESKRRIQSVKAPILFLHGTRDDTIPIGFGKALFEAAPEPKEMAILTGAGHSDIFLFGALSRITDFLAKYRGAAARGPG